MSMGPREGTGARKGLEDHGRTRPVCPEEFGLAAPAHPSSAVRSNGASPLWTLCPELAGVDIFYGGGQWAVTLYLPLDRTKTTIHHGEAGLQLLWEAGQRPWGPGRGYH